MAGADGPPAGRTGSSGWKELVAMGAARVRLGTALLVIWLIIGVLAAWQRNYFTESSESCAGAGTIAVTILAGPLNYLGANPKVSLSCHLPQPSK
jgi:hypothetical protein